MPVAPEMKTYEDLKQKTTNDQLQKLIKEIDEIKVLTKPENERKIGNDVLVDKQGEVAEKALNQGLLDVLNNQDIGTLQILLGEVGKTFNGLEPNDPVKQDVKKLFDLLKGVCEQKINKLSSEQNEKASNQLKQSFDKFNDMILNGKLDRLNTLKDREVDDVVNFVSKTENKSVALNLYYAMQKAVLTAPKNFKHTDRKNFYNVFDKIKSLNYGEIGSDGVLQQEKLKEADLNEVFKDMKAAGLKDLAKNFASIDNWDGKDIAAITADKFKTNGKSFTAEDFRAKFNSVNGERIKKNADIIFATLPENFDVSKFQVTQEGNLQYKKDGQENFVDLTVDDMKSLLGLDDAKLQSADFLNEVEKNDTLNSKFKDFCKAIIDKKNNSNEGNENQEKPLDKCVLSDADLTKMQSALGDKMFITKDGDNFKYNLVNLKNFLKDVTNDNFRSKYWNLSRGSGRTVGTGERKALHSAVQILLNTEHNAGVDVNGKWTRGSKYCQEVKNFQLNNNKKTTTPLVVDGIPGPKTLAVLFGDYSASTPDLPEVVVVGSGIENFSKLGFQFIKEISEETKRGLNIPDKSAVFKRKEGNDNGMYFKEGNNIVRVSADDPWLKRTMVLPSGENPSLSFENMEVKLNVFDKGVESLNNIITGSEILKNSKLSFLRDGENYKLQMEKNGGKVDLALPDNFFTKDFCGLKMMEDKLKTIYMVINLKSQGLELKSGEDLPLSFGKAAINYGFDTGNTDNREAFIAYYNKLELGKQGNE